MSEAQNRQRVNVSVFQAFGSPTVSIQCGASRMSISQLEAVTLMRKLRAHFGDTDGAAVRAIERVREEKAAARKESITKEISALLLTDRREREALEAEAVAMGAVVDWDEYGEQRICWPEGTPRFAGKAIGS